MSVERRFRAILAKEGTRVYLPIPFDPNDVWGQKDRHCLIGSIGGRGIRGAVAKFADGFGLPTGPVWLRDNGLAAGIEVEADLRQEGPQLDNVSVDLTAALQANEAARSFFEGLPTFYRKNYLRWIDSAKRPETRAKRIAEAMIQLAGGVRR